VIAFVDARTLDERQRVDGTGTYQDVVVRPSVDRFYLAREDRAIIEVRRLTTGALVDSIRLSRPAFGLALRPNSQELWVAHPQTSAAAGALSVASLATGTTSCTPIWDPRRIAFSADGGQGVVSSQSGEVFFLRP
jgi:hypothetical protein